MKVLSLFSGVGGFDMGLEVAGMTTAFQCEIDKHARAVLDHHWPTVPKWDDVTTLTGAYVLEQTGGVDIVAWGSPCQDLSVAGQRAGLAGAKSGLFHEGVRIIKELRELTNGKCPTWSLWENVPGALSSNGGADFGQVLYEMDEAGACFSEWAVLDAQYFGVPQRRRRVFVASCFDSGTAAGCSDPLFPVAESGVGDSAKGGAKGEAVAGASSDSVGEDSRTTFVKAKRAMSADDHDRWEQAGVSPTLNAFDVGDVRTVTAVVEAYPIQDGRGLDKNQNGFGVGDSTDPSYTLDATGGQSVAQVMAVVEPVLAFDTQFGSNANVFENQSPTLKASQQPPSALVEPLIFQPGSMLRLNAKPSDTTAPTLRAESKGGDNQPYVVQGEPLIFQQNQRDELRVMPGYAGSLSASSGMNNTNYVVQGEPLLIDGRRVDDVRVYEEPVQTLGARMGTGGNNVPLVGVVGTLSPGAHPGGVNGQDAYTGQLIPVEFHNIEAESYDEYNDSLGGGVHHSLRAGTKQSTGVLHAGGFKPGASAKAYSVGYEEGLAPSLEAGGGGNNKPGVVTPELAVRRLTPLECERLMGWPDHHTSTGINGPISDSQRYKMCGNGVASPVAAWLGRVILNARH